MNFKVNPIRIRNSANDLLSLSRLLRKNCAEIESVRYDLRTQTELAACAAQLKKQEENAQILVGRLVQLSVGLQSVSDIYEKTEMQNAEALENGSKKRIHRLIARLAPLDPRIWIQLRDVLYRGMGGR